MTFKATDMVFVHNKWSCQMILKSHHAGHGYGWKETWFHRSTLTLVRAWDTPSLQNHFEIPLKFWTGQKNVPLKPMDKIY